MNKQIFVAQPRFGHETEISSIQLNQNVILYSRPIGSYTYMKTYKKQWGKITTQIDIN